MAAFALPLLAAALGIGVNVAQTKREERKAGAAQAQENIEIGLIEQALGPDQGPVSGFIGSEDPKFQDIAIRERERRAEERRGAPAAAVAADTAQTALEQAQLNLQQDRGLEPVPLTGEQVLQRQRFEFEKLVKTDALEKGLRTEYGRAIAPAVAIINGVETARRQMQLGTPTGSFNVGRLFIQQLDSSMITNPELQAVASLPGVAKRIDNLRSQLTGTGPFGPEQQAEIVASMRSIADEMSKAGQSIRDEFTGVAQNSAFPLNIDNIITGAGFVPALERLEAGRPDAGDTGDGRRTGDTITVDSDP